MKEINTKLDVNEVIQVEMTVGEFAMLTVALGSHSDREIKCFLAKYQANDFGTYLEKIEEEALAYSLYNEMKKINSAHGVRL